MAELKINLFGRSVRCVILTSKQKTQDIYGYTNRTEDAYYLPFLDYDGVPLDFIIKELGRLQFDFRLSTFFVFKSSPNNYHAVCLDKLTYKELIDVMHDSSVDSAYYSIGRRYGDKIWTLRLSDKGEYKIRLYCILNHKPKRMRSKAHAELLKKFFGISMLTLELGVMFDDSTDVVLAKYKV